MAASRCTMADTVCNACRDNAGASHADVDSRATRHACLILEVAMSPFWRPFRCGRLGETPSAPTFCITSHRTGSSPPSPLLDLPAQRSRSILSETAF